MRKRAFRPEVLDSLEDRRLMSGVGTASAGAGNPYVLSLRTYHLIGRQLKQGFDLFRRNLDPGQIVNEHKDVIVLVPYQAEDHLRARRDEIVQRMIREIRAGVPHAVRRAEADLLGTVRGSIEAHVRAGQVVIR